MRNNLKVGICFGMLIWITFELTFCKRKKANDLDNIRQEAEKIIKPKMNDPDSYEFVELQLYDSTLYIDNMEKEKKYIDQRIDLTKSELEIQNNYLSLMPSSYDKQEVKKSKRKIVNLKKMLIGIDSIKKALMGEVNGVAAYKYALRFRAKNAFGAKVLNEYIVETDPAPTYKVINVATKPGEYISTPNDFPGFKQLSTQYNYYEF